MNVNERQYCHPYKSAKRVYTKNVNIKKDSFKFMLEKLQAY